MATTSGLLMRSAGLREGCLSADAGSGKRELGNRGFPDIETILRPCSLYIQRGRTSFEQARKGSTAWETQQKSFNGYRLLPMQQLASLFTLIAVRNLSGFCIRVNLNSNEPPGAFTSIAAQLTEGVTSQFFDSLARTLWVHNQTVGPQPFIGVGLIRFRQGF